ncbi:hypothetical protein BGW38_004155 [Lunasporangiospora selenospora]|uniref:Methyltransferase type 11 domain-containing protein n=1 Tax=Lunasporangiospora selenospora TaxID=979761 RepID=A0A9P6FQJ3_9FUNG|nr:hypothetical protein BGW38_004155 [Lunasporangiospora selenospora]
MTVNEQTSKTDDQWSSTKYNHHASFVPALGKPVLQLLDPKPDEHILDLGAGDGILTRDLEQLTKSVVAIDASADMIQAATKNGCRDARVVDGHDLVDNELANGQFDAVFSNAALHWMKKDPVKVIQGVHKALRPQGRFVAECGGFMNVADVRSGLHAALRRRGVDPEPYDPWFFPGKSTYTRMLEENGFKVESMELIPRMTMLNTDIAGWIDTFGFTFLAPFESEEERKAIRDEVQQNLSFAQDDGAWCIMYVRLRFKAVKV